MGIPEGRTMVFYFLPLSGLLISKNAPRPAPREILSGRRSHGGRMSDHHQLDSLASDNLSPLAGKSGVSDDHVQHIHFFKVYGFYGPEFAGIRHQYLFQGGLKHGLLYCNLKVMRTGHAQGGMHAGCR